PPCTRPSSSPQHMPQSLRSKTDSSACSGSGGAGSSGRPSRGSSSFTVHLADELEVYFNEVAHGRPVGFVASAKWKPPTDIFETDDALVVCMDIAGMRSEDFSVQLADGILTIGGERKVRRDGKPHYHAM